MESRSSSLHQKHNLLNQFPKYQRSSRLLQQKRNPLNPLPKLYNLRRTLKQQTHKQIVR